VARALGIPLEELTFGDLRNDGKSDKHAEQNVGKPL
jgi:hypothetical protein